MSGRLPWTQVLLVTAHNPALLSTNYCNRRALIVNVYLTVELRVELFESDKQRMAIIRITLISVKVEEYSHFIGGKTSPFPSCQHCAAALALA